MMCVLSKCEPFDHIEHFQLRAMAIEITLLIRFPFYFVDIQNV